MQGMERYELRMMRKFGIRRIYTVNMARAKLPADASNFTGGPLVKRPHNTVYLCVLHAVYL